MVDYDWNCRKVEGHNYYLPRVITERNFTEYRFRSNFLDPKNPLMLITNSSLPYYAKTPDQKIQLILNRANYGPGKLFFVWMGSYSSDTFYLSGILVDKALKLLGYKSDEDKLEELKAKVRKLEISYRIRYRSAQRAQGILREDEEALLNAKTERDMLEAHLHPTHPDAVKFNRAHGYPLPTEDTAGDTEYNYPADRYTHPEDNDYWN